jgi:membrane protease YdiL (CAAX protease family)
MVDRLKNNIHIVVYGSILLAFVLWYLVFILKPFNFWILMACNTLLLIFISTYLGGTGIRRDEINVSNILLGIGSALLLYAIFWIGNKIIISISTLIPLLFSDRTGNLDAIYANRESLPSLAVAGLLFFPIGFGEELYWRGFIQRYYSRKWNGSVALLITTLFYVLVHLPTGNPVLIIAALTCGVFWGFMYMVTGKLVPVLISHMIWDPLIFVFFPVR